METIFSDVRNEYTHKNALPVLAKRTSTSSDTVREEIRDELLSRETRR